MTMLDINGFGAHKAAYDRSFRSMARAWWVTRRQGDDWLGWVVWWAGVRLSRTFTQPTAEMG